MELLAAATVARQARLATSRVVRYAKIGKLIAQKGDDGLWYVQPYATWPENVKTYIHAQDTKGNNKRVVTQRYAKRTLHVADPNPPAPEPTPTPTEPLATPAPSLSDRNIVGELQHISTLLAKQVNEANAIYNLLVKLDAKGYIQIKKLEELLAAWKGD